MKPFFFFLSVFLVLCSCKTQSKSFSLNEKEIRELEQMAENIKPIGNYEVSITDFGAVGDGKTSATNAIQKAINHLYSKGGGILRIPEGTFLLTKTGTNQLLIPRPGVSIIGAGKNSVLKVAENTVKFQVYYSISKAPELRIENAVFKNFTIDCNGANNLPPGKNRNKNAAIGTRFGKNILIDNVTIRNNAGRQCFQFGNNEMPFTVQNLAIQNCTFSNLGRNVNGNTTQNDHSAIYAQAKNCLIRNNDFRNSKLETDATAMEIHASFCLVEGNYVKNFGTGCNIVSIVTDMHQVLIRNNVFDGIERGLLFYTHKDHEMSHVEITANEFIQLVSTNPIIDASINVNHPIDSILIKDNLLKNTDEPGEARAHGIVLGKQQFVIIAGNTFVGTSGNAIRVGKTEEGMLTAKISENRFINCAKTFDTHYQQVISIKSNKIAQSISIENNNFINSSQKKEVVPIDGNMEVKQLNIQKNEFKGYQKKMDKIWIESNRVQGKK